MQVTAVTVTGITLVLSRKVVDHSMRTAAFEGVKKNIISTKMSIWIKLSCRIGNNLDKHKKRNTNATKAQILLPPPRRLCFCLGLSVRLFVSL